MKNSSISEESGKVECDVSKNNPFYDFLRGELKNLKAYQQKVGVQYFDAFLAPGSPHCPQSEEEVSNTKILDHLNYVLPPDEAEKLASFVFQEVDKPLYETMEDRFGADIVLHDTSGYLGNLSMLECLVCNGLPVYYDNNAHASLQMGVRMTKANPSPEKMIDNLEDVVAMVKSYVGKVLPQGIIDQLDSAVRSIIKSHNYFRFKHNSPEHLDELIEKNGPGLVVVDSVYSVHGDIVSDDVIKVSHDRKCIILLDESHSVGGLVSPGSLLLNDNKGWNAHVITFSTGKGLAVPGGIGLVMPEFTKEIINSCFDGEDNQENRDLIQTYFRRAISRIFTNSVTDHNKSVLNKNVQEIANSQDRAELVYETALWINEKLRAGGVKIKSQSPIIFIECGDASVAYQVHRELLNNDVRGAYFCEPATNRNGVGVRFTLNYDFCKESGNPEALVKQILDACRKHDVKCMK